MKACTVTFRASRGRRLDLHHPPAAQREARPVVKARGASPGKTAIQIKARFSGRQAFRESVRDHYSRSSTGPWQDYCWYGLSPAVIVKAAMNEPDFYLASADSYNLENPRRVWRIKRMSLPQRDDLLLVKVDPPILGEGVSATRIEYVLLATRHQGASLFPINEWPASVHVILVPDTLQPEYIPSWAMPPAA